MREYFDYLFTLERTGMKYDLTNIKRILNKLDNPQSEFRSIHIAGTNGKGATASLIASILMEHGYITGLFTSPHIVRFNERIRINDKCISDSYIKSFLTENQSIIKKIKPSFFEVNTAMAFQYFAENNIDVAVVECGLGGRLDSTNVLRPELSIITQIGMDHMQYLGNSLKKIALEKIGIVKRGIDVVVSDNNSSLRRLFKAKINNKNLYYLDDKVKIKVTRNNFKGSRFKIKTEDSNYSVFDIPLPGKYQVRNAAAAIIAAERFLENIGFEPDEKKIKIGLKKVMSNAGLRCRLELMIIKNKELIIDISHNADGIKQINQSLKGAKPDVVIFGMMEDKDLEAAMKELLKLSNTIVFTRANSKRAANPKTLYDIALKYSSPKHTLIVREDIKRALDLIFNDIVRYKRILITGSFFIAGEAIRALKVQDKF